MAGGGFSVFVAYSLGTGNEKFYREVVMPATAKFVDPERAHELAVWSASKGILPSFADVSAKENPNLSTRVFGLHFRHPIGLAAGFDKNSEAPENLLKKVGFSHVEVGTVTPQPQPGNPKKRVFRLTEDRAIINRYGFNSHGQEKVAERLDELRHRPVPGIIGVNVGKNKETVDAAADYVSGIAKLGDFADYLVINISSPNTPGLRDLQRQQHLVELLQKTISARNSLKIFPKPPLLLKISPDLSQKELQEICTLIRKPDCRVDGLIVSNTTVSRDNELNLVSDPDLVKETGGLSGAPLKSKSTEMIRNAYRLTDGAVPIVGVGGVSSGEDALEKIRAGASLVQLYSALAFTGPGVVERICKEMTAILKEQNVKNVGELVGIEHRK